MKFNITAGYWTYCIKDRKTLQFLAVPQRIFTIENSTTIDIAVPEKVKNNKNARIILTRIR